MQSMLALPVSSNLSNNHLEYLLMGADTKQVKRNPEPLIIEGKKIASDVFKKIVSEVSFLPTPTFESPLKLRVSIKCLNVIHAMKHRMNAKKKFRDTENIITIIAYSAIRYLNRLFMLSNLKEHQPLLSSQLSWYRIVDEETGKSSKSLPDTISIIVWMGDELPQSTSSSNFSDCNIKDIFRDKVCAQITMPKSKFEFQPELELKVQGEDEAKDEVKNETKNSLINCRRLDLKVLTFAISALSIGCYVYLK